MVRRRWLTRVVSAAGQVVRGIRPSRLPSLRSRIRRSARPAASRSTRPLPIFVTRVLALRSFSVMVASALGEHGVEVGRRRTGGVHLPGPPDALLLVDRGESQDGELGEHRAAEHGVGVAPRRDGALGVVQQQEQHVLRDQRHAVERNCVAAVATALLPSVREQDPVRRRLAVCQRPAPHRPRGRFRRALRRVQPLHADGGPRRAHGLGHRRARHADPGRGRPAGRRGARPGGQEQRHHRPGPRRPRAVLRPVHPHHDRQPLQRRAGAVQRRAQERLHGRADDVRRHLAVDRPHPARPLHRGHLPDLRVRRGARRPVRQLRQPARPDRPDQPAVEDQRRDAGVRRDPALLPRPAGAGRAHCRSTSRAARPRAPGGPTSSSSR